MDPCLSMLSSGLPQWLSGKEPTCNAGNARDTGLFPGSRRSPGGGHGNPLQYSCLGNPMERGAWQATVHRVDTELDLTEATKQQQQQIHKVGALIL